MLINTHMKKILKSIHDFIIEKLTQHPLLVIPAIAAWIALSLVLTFISALPIIIPVLYDESIIYDILPSLYVLHHITTFFLLSFSWIFLIYVVFKVYWHNMMLDSDRNPIYSSVSLVVNSIFIFSVLIYLAQALTGNAAFSDIHPVPDNSYMTIIWDPLGGLVQIPQAQTVFDCIYYSYSLITGSGLSNTEPVNNIGKAIAMFGVATSVGLIAIVLSAAVGRAYEKHEMQ